MIKGLLIVLGRYVCCKTPCVIEAIWSPSIASKACIVTVLPVAFFTTKFNEVVVADCAIEAVLNPEVAGPTKANGTI